MTEMPFSIDPFDGPEWSAGLDVPIHHFEWHDGRGVVLAEHVDLVRDVLARIGAMTKDVSSCEFALRFLQTAGDYDGPERATDAQEQCHFPIVDAGSWSIRKFVDVLLEHDVRVKTEYVDSLEDLAAPVEQGAIAVAATNIGLVFGQPGDIADGYAHDLLPVVGVVRDAESLEIVGFQVIDTALSHASQMVDANAMVAGWLDLGGLVTVAEKLNFG